MKFFFIHDDRLNFMKRLGKTEIKRASHVEPNADSMWEADLSPVNGPVLGPFNTRQEAIDAELAYLRQHVIGGSSANTNLLGT